MTDTKELSNFIWDIANSLRGDYKQSDYGKVILPLTVLRRLDCILEPTKKDVLDYLPKVKNMDLKNTDPLLNNIAKQNFHNKSKYDFKSLISDPDNLAANLNNYIMGFSKEARDIIIEYFEFEKQIEKLDKANSLFEVVKRFSEIDLHPNKVNSIQMGYIFEELIRKFSELSNETAGEHFTPREVIKLMVNLLFSSDKEILSKKGIIKTLYDPACGTGGMLSIAEEYLRELNPEARLELFGQELNDESYAICKSDMLIKNQNITNIKFGNTLTADGLKADKFDYMLSNPPFGVSWKKYSKPIKDEYENLGYTGRFGAGLPRISDGSLLFLQHMISKMKLTGSKIAIVFNGSPLFSGSAGAGESEIRKWIIENDWLEAIIALPDQLFYNTGIFTYIWVVNNNKDKMRKGKIQLINAVSDKFYKKMKKSLGNKRNFISEDAISDITKIYGEFKENEYCKIFPNKFFGYTQIVVERPLLQDNKVVKDKSGNPKPDGKLRDTENVPLMDNIDDYFAKEVKPYVSDAWMDRSKDKIGYEINFTRYFYVFKPLRKLEDIKKDILALEKETDDQMKKVF